MYFFCREFFPLSSQRHSMRILWTLLPRKRRCRPSTPSINRRVWLNSLPPSARTLEGIPNSCIDLRKMFSDVRARLSVVTSRCNWSLEKPSTHPWTTKFQWMSLWFVSMCHKKLGVGTEYTRRLIAFANRSCVPTGSTFLRATRTLWTGNLRKEKHRC